MKQLHIYAYGDIENIQASDISEWGIVSLKDITDKINSNPDAEEIILHIHSRGGDVNEGFAIHDALVSSGKKIITIVEGLCASIATVIALAAKPEDRKMTENSTYFIHNPWNFAIGDAEEMRRNADVLDEAENKLADFYQKKTKADISVIRDYMKSETSFTAEQAKEFGFISEVVQTTNAKIYAKIKPMKKNKPALKAQQESPKALDLPMEDGKTLHVVTENAEPSVGDEVTIDGAPVNEGEYTLSNGTIIKVDGESKISEIIAPASASDESTANAKLLARVDELFAKVSELETLKAKASKLEDDNKELEESSIKDKEEILKLKTEIQNLKKQVRSNYEPTPEEAQFRKHQEIETAKAKAVEDAVSRFKNKNKKQ